LENIDPSVAEIVINGASLAAQLITNGTEPTWTADLSSTSQATSDLLACQKKLLGGKGGGST